MKPALRDFPDGLIEIDSEWAKRIGFTSDIFVLNGDVGSQLFKRGNCMYIQAIQVINTKRRQGHFNNLLNQLWGFGFTVKVPNPLPQMCKILEKKEFEKVSEQSLATPETELEVVMVKSPPSHVAKTR